MYGKSISSKVALGCSVGDLDLVLDDGAVIVAREGALEEVGLVAISCEWATGGDLMCGVLTARR